MIFGFGILATALLLSAVAAWYSVAGLTAIFSAATIPVIIMGGSLELGKIVATVWLHNNWRRAGIVFKLYLIPAIAFLMILTSMGIFGYLSKAHSDQSLVSGDVVSKIAIYDEKIKTEKENIEANRKALKQMDEGVDQVLGRSTTETGAEKAVAMRRTQQKERTRLQAEISQSQKSIAELNDARAPIAAEVRKVEAEVGPIKYIAALVYGDNPESGVLEKAVRWVIILIVGVFDPLAVVLILAGYRQIEWAREDRLAAAQEKSLEDEPASTVPNYEPDDGPLADDQVNQIKEMVKDELPVGTVIAEEELFPAAVTTEEDEAWQAIEEKQKNAAPNLLDQHPYLLAPRGASTPPKIRPVGPLVIKEESVEPVEPVAKVVPVVKVEVEPVAKVVAPAPIEQVKKVRPRYTIADHGQTIDVEGKTISMGILQDMYPDIYAELQLAASADNQLAGKKLAPATFGITFPRRPERGEMFLHVATLPSKLYKFNGADWIVVDKNVNDSYTYNVKYLKFLVEKIEQGQISLDDLTEIEQEKIAEYLKKNA